MRWSDLAVLLVFGLPLAAQPIGGGIFGKMPTGTVTSVGLSASAPLQVSGSPITGSGTMSLSFQNQSANTVMAGPTSGGAAAPGFIEDGHVVLSESEPPAPAPAATASEPKK